jgi:hypothetical protein
MLVAAPAQASGSNSGGGGTGGGGKTTAGSGTCAPIASYNVTTGYYQQWAATWAAFTLAPCQVGATGWWDVQYLNDGTGQIDFERSGGYTLTSTGYSYTLDDDFGPFDTTYTVTLTTTDSTGAQASRSSTITTRSPKTPGA